jgi:hypothetical protein
MTRQDFLKEVKNRYPGTFLAYEHRAIDLPHLIDSIAQELFAISEINSPLANEVRKQWLNSNKITGLLKFEGE